MYNPHNFSQTLLLLLLLVIVGCNPTSPSTVQDYSNGDVLKAATVNPTKRKQATAPAVIYRSQDFGVTWSPFANGIPKDATLSGIQEDANKIYVTTDYNGIYFSTNGQNNWKALNENQLSGLDINCIEVDDDHLIVGTLNRGIFISQDGGLNWNPPIRNIKSPIRAFLKSDNNIYAGTDSGIFKSADRGATWSHHFGQLQILGFTKLNGKIYAATQSGVLLMEADQKNWNSIYEGDALHDIGNDGRYIYAMTIGQELLKTQNDGQSWENAQSGLSRPPNYYTNELKHIGRDVFSAQWDGVYHSMDHGGSWRRLEGLVDSVAFSTLEVTNLGIFAGVSIR